ncbi:MAG: hypothetical protein AB1750_17610, partial [Chloroflexota bacterium]
MKITTLLVPAITVLILIACAPENAATNATTSVSTSETLEGCIPPQFHSDYPRGSEIYITPSPQQKILPLGWAEVSNIPNYIEGKEIGILLRPRLGYDELWVSIEGNSSPVIYRMDTKQWRQAPTPRSGQLFLDSNNSVWSTAFSNIFFRLDDETNQFVQIADKTNELGGGDMGLARADASGLLWFTVRFDQKNSPLFSFDPVTLEVKQRLPGNFDSFIAIDKSGRIYVIEDKQEPYSEERLPPLALTQYNPVNGDTDTIEISRANEEVGDGRSMYVDRDNRLWVSDNVWIDIAGSRIGDQHAIPRSEIFIEYQSYRRSFEWTRPMVM